MTDSNSKDNLTYTGKREKLLEIVSQLEGSNPDIEESLQLWKEANELAKWCKEFLETAKKTIEKEL